MRNLLTAIVFLSAGPAVAETVTLTTDVWVDNWFEMYVNGQKVLEDSVSITTERSFNAESATFTAELPITVAIRAMDFRENDTGLEYIGSNRQQMGDGGMIAQFRDATTGETVAVTDSDMRCLVVHRAPVDVSCARESNPVAGEGACDFVETAVAPEWVTPAFDDSDWPAAVTHSARAVDPKDGYDEVSWDSAAMLVWSDDLVQDNTVLCRMTISQ
ncbi:PEBP family protein [Tateyamaria sp. SN3-11]|uniref:PEBP family protein n=1 Tax=Tateyamaria sp. SN3-11 TaxID=3092147 RepID=UPI0039EA0964